MPRWGQRQYQVFFIGYYESTQGLTSDYIVIPFTQLVEAKTLPNERASWRVTPQRTNRVLFDRERPLFPLKASYDAQRESILRFDHVSGKFETPQGEPVPIFDPVGAENGELGPSHTASGPAPTRGDFSSSSSSGSHGPQPIKRSEKTDKPTIDNSVEPTPPEI